MGKNKDVFFCVIAVDSALFFREFHFVFFFYLFECVCLCVCFCLNNIYFMIFFKCKIKTCLYSIYICVCVFLSFFSIFFVCFFLLLFYFFLFLLLAPRGGVIGLPVQLAPYTYLRLSAGFKIWNEHINESSTDIMAPVCVQIYLPSKDVIIVIITVINVSKLHGCHHHQVILP